MKFDLLKDDFSYPRAEESVLAFWKDHDIFRRSLDAAKSKPPFTFYEGPPTANGRPGIHHVMSRTIKDIICRYKAMTGYRVDRKGGWDTHGLPVEIEVEKELGLESRAQVEEYGIAPYNAACRRSVLKYKELWDTLTVRMGYWVDLDQPYITFENNYIESVWWLLKQLHEKDLLYKGYKIQWYSPGSHTILSSHEVSLGYRETQDPSVYIRFALDGEPNTYFLAWTTTPWTLISNAALAVGPDIDYVKIKTTADPLGEHYLIMAQALVETVIKEDYEVVASYKGTDLVDKRYTPLFDYYVASTEPGTAWKVIPADYVSTEDGTGLVHIAPAFGAEDYENGKKFNIPALNAVGPDGHFRDEATLVAGEWFKDADKKITRDLRERGLLYRHETYLHNYPFDWRKQTPLMQYPIEGWFIRTTRFKNRLIELNKTINWLPSSIGEKRFGEWLENNVDWALSRRRYWGTPLPIWQSDKDDSDFFEVIGSIAELREKAGDQIPDDDTLDLHRPFVDTVTWPAPDGGTMRRVPDLIDVWFDSGSMPFAQWHYPFENKDIFERSFPGDFIAEGLDQTRGWFYTLHAIATLVKDSVAYKNVIVNGLLLDENGEKMSKSRGNVVDPFSTIDEYGADPTRWYMMASSAPWLPMKFSFESLKEAIRKYFETLRNTYSFFALYANTDDVAATATAAGQSIGDYLEAKAGPSERFDTWIVSRFNTLAKEMRAHLDAYEITKPVRMLQDFVIDDLSNWYVRNNRRRFWAEGDDPSKYRAYATLHAMLEGVARLSAPFTPMIAELFYRALRAPVGTPGTADVSVHMVDYPQPDESVIDTDLETAMALSEKVVSLGRAARTRHNLKVRQPLARMLVGAATEATESQLAPSVEIIKAELNIKDVAVIPTAELESHVSYTAKLNFKVAGSRLGKQAKAAGAEVARLTDDQIRTLNETGSIAVSIDGTMTDLTAEEILVTKNEEAGFAVESEGPVTVALVTTLTDELIDEGFAREMVNKIQNMRKTTGLDVTDTIRVSVAGPTVLKNAASKHEAFIRQEVLADDFTWFDNGDVTEGTAWTINGEKATIAIVKA